MLHMIISIVGILVTILFVVGTHEFAHFQVARLLKIKVLRFSIGFGKILWHWYDKKNTEYVLALIPLGGYVKMLDETEGHVKKEELHLAFNRQPFYKKFLVVAAGPLANIFCAFVLYWLIFVIGFTTVRPIIDVVPGSIAAQSGLKAGQEIVRIDNTPAKTWNSILFHIIAHVGDQDHLYVEVKSAVQKTTVMHQLNLANWHLNELSPDPLTSLGIKPYGPDLSLVKMKYNPLSAITEAWNEVVNFTYFNFLLFSKLITGKLSLQSLGGPIMIFESAGDALNSGFLVFLAFLAFLSIAIGVINILPVPGLDGGHLLIQLIELIIRRPLPEKCLMMLYSIGLLFILTLFSIAIFNDLMRIHF